MKKSTYVLIAEGSKASEKKIPFVTLKNPIPVKGKFAYWIKEDNYEYVSYAPYNKKNTHKK